MKKITDICYSEATGQCLDLYLPEASAFPVMVYFHGGGLESGDKAADNNLYPFLAARGIAVVSVNYRMYPEAKYPDYIADAADAVLWVISHMASYGDVRGIYVGGSSAGGYLSQMLCFDQSWLTSRGIPMERISGFIHDAGQPTSHFNVLREQGIHPGRLIVDETAPLYHVGTGEFCPPMLIIVSTEDIPNRYEQTLLLVSTLKLFGHGGKVTLQVMEGKHCAYVNALDKNGQSILGSLIADFIRSQDKI